MSDLTDLAVEIGSYPIDRKFLPQEELDLTSRERTSSYPWRGQFSPDLIDKLLEAHCQTDSIVLDPYVGSGTVLFEAARRGLECFGSEINPAAVALAGMARFSCLDKAARAQVCGRVQRTLGKYIDAFLPVKMYGPEDQKRYGSPATVELSARELLQELADDEYCYNIALTSIMMAMKDGSSLNPRAIIEAFERNKSIVGGLPFSSKKCKVFMSDARELPIPTGKVDLVITSPPYINVFNYHQNYRKAMELAGWDLLEIAQSESGSNRKHRGNRFKTVVQYCMDLALMFREVKRVLAPGRLAVFVIGRESRVRGVSFHNAQLLAIIASGRVGFKLRRWQERKFTSRFGETIFEDLVTFELSERRTADAESWGKQVGLWALERALTGASGDVALDIKQALGEAEEIRPSPMLRAKTISSARK